MLKPYHIEICQRALGVLFSPRALDSIIAANLAQDVLRNQIGHAELHFDDNAFAAGNAYLEAQRHIILEALDHFHDEALLSAWRAFGRLTHTAQDFYAHSNYIRLWAASFPPDELPAPSEVEALKPEILRHPQLRSGKIYLWDWLAFVPGLSTLAYRLLPPDSHTHMNLDSPRRGALFPYAREAAIQRTRREYEHLAGRMERTALARFTDR